MATGLTPVRSRPYPLETDAPDVAADMHTLALNLDQVPDVTSGTTLPVSGMVPGDEFLLTPFDRWYKYNGAGWFPFVSFMESAPPGSATIAYGTMTTGVAGATLTLPVPAAGEVLVITAGSGATGASPVTISSSSTIKGKGLSATSFVLGTPWASVTLCGDGTVWQIVSGEQDTGWHACVVAPNTSSVASVRLIGDIVRMKGSVSATSTLSPTVTITTIPSGFRPLNNIILPGYINGSSDSATEVDITSSSGVVFLDNTLTSGFAVSFEGLTWALT